MKLLPKKTQLSSIIKTKSNLSPKKNKLFKNDEFLKNMKLYKNSSGTRVLIMPNRKDTESASLYFYFKVGSKNEKPKVYGISHFIEHMLFKGSPKYPNYLDISKTFDSNGIMFNAYTSKDITAYHYKFLSTKENLDLICKITSDMIFHSFMLQKDITPERNVIIQEYNDGLDDINNVVNDKLEECIFEGHPLAHTIIGSLDTLKNINRKEIMNYYKKHYTSDNLLISFTGKYNSTYIDIINKYFKTVIGKKTNNNIISRNNNSNNNIISSNYIISRKTRKLTKTKLIKEFKSINIKSYKPKVLPLIPFIDKYQNYKINCFYKSLTQDYINIVFKTQGYYDPNTYYYKLLENILGGNMSSRLFVEIREKLGLAYTIKCDITNYEEVGYFNIYSQNESKDTIQCLEHIFKELIKFKKHGTNKTELENNKKNYCDIYKTSFDDIEDENEYYANQLLFNKPFESIAMRIKNIEAITEEQLKICSNELFNLNKVHIVTIGKVKKENIEKVLKKFL
jgi:predicted Zn-dependent peptidase